MPYAKSIADIKSALLHPATTSHFEIQIDTSKVPSDYLRSNGVLLDTGKLNLLCSEATLPGSSLATLELTNDHTGVTERHAYRRVYDDRIDLTFYVDVENYMPIRFFESWIKYIANESRAVDDVVGSSLESENYSYRFKYRDEYASNELSVTKFERSMMGGAKGRKGSPLTYRFLRAYPISISSMPVSYDSSSLLKCTVSMTYIRYYVDGMAGNTLSEVSNTTPIQQAQFNSSNLSLTGLTGVGALSSGGVPLSVANASGNSVDSSNSIDRRVEAGLPYVGRNVGPGQRFAGI